MRTLRVGIGIALLAVAITPIGTAASAGDAAVGGGWRLPLNPAFSKAAWELAVHSDASGGNARGDYTFSREGSNLTGVVTCLRVAGGRAVVAGRITGGNIAGDGFVVWLDNGGVPGSGQPGPDQVSTTEILPDSRFPADVLDTCPSLDPADYGVGWYAVEGNVLVIDR